MSRNHSLFSPPASFEKAAKRLTNRNIKLVDARNLLLVELSFRLFEKLRLADEPITTPWVLLSGMPLHEPRLVNISLEGRRAIANARQLIPFSARFAWLNALRDYCKLELVHRHYTITETDWHKQTIDGAKQPDNDPNFDPSRQALYDEWLSAPLPYRRKKTPSLATADIPYQFEANAKTGTGQLTKPTLSVSFKSNTIDNIPKPPAVWFAERPESEVFTVQWADLLEDAIWLNEREHILHQQYGSSTGDWIKRFESIRLRKVMSDKSISSEAPLELTIDGFMHLAGMVASGKSTLATLLAVHVALYKPHQRITIVVGDVQSAIQLANQFNTWLCHDPEIDTPKAVPLFGRSSRSNHIHTFYQSDEYQQFSSRHQPHWGERWLSPLCPLQAFLSDSTVTDQLFGQLITTGKEPCNGLKPTGSVADSDSGDENEELGRNPKTQACPFLGVCPQYQAIRDMPGASIWITTPGGLGSSIPSQFDNRPISMGEVVYEQSDLVIFDEADAVINWFDNQFAETLSLTGSPDSILDKVAVPSAQYAIANRVMPSATARWIGGERNAQQAVSAMLTLLDPFRGQGCLRQWVAKHFFTPLHLLDRLTYRVAGLEEVASPDLTEIERNDRDERVRPIRQLFDRLLNDDDRLQTDRPSDELLLPSYELSRIMQVINSSGESANNPVIHQQCVQWLMRHFPDIEQRLTDLRQQLSDRRAQQQQAKPSHRRKSKNSDNDTVDTLVTLAYRLQFALTVLLLDQHNQTVLYEWENRPYTMLDDSPVYRRNTVLRSLLPLPLTGRQFGTYHTHDDSDSEQNRRSNTQSVSLFAYTNIGRSYVLNFHRLLTDYTGRLGPNVLAMSGTSYLPDSTTFHVSTPQAILIPAKKAEEAIEKSIFRFCPQLVDGKPLRISGNLQKVGLSLFPQLARALAGHNGQGLVQQALDELTQLANECPDQWKDRQRLLVFVNSYDQADLAAEALRDALPTQRNTIKFLVNDSSSDKDSPYAIRRTDIEQFAHTNGAILVAPLSAIGRGFNILNIHRKAAFGAVFFLTRPYPHPHDTQSIARELNRRAFDWADDPNYEAWAQDGLGQKAEEIRKRAARYWRLAESRSYYRTLRDVPELMAKPRLDLAATTIGHLVQAVGRLIRGDVPFRAYFIDAAWAPGWAENGQPESPHTSLLAALIEALTNYVYDDPICEALYKPLADRFDWIENFERTNDLTDK